MTPQQFAIAESVRHARTLSYRDCLEYLHGLLLLAGDSDEAHPVRLALMAITQGDAQLELIASGQMKLGLDDATEANGKDGQ